MRQRIGWALMELEVAVDERTRYRWEDRTAVPFAFAQRVVCRLLGHAPAADHCGIPDHDCCAFCGVSTPGQARR